MEYGTDQAADYCFDLNNVVPAEWHEQFDVIYDGGTCEHIFNLPNCMSNICHMLNINGRVLHEAGCSGAIDHGFYALQPAFFYDFYLANHFLIDECLVAALSKQHQFVNRATVRSYLPGMYDFEKAWPLDAENGFFTFFAATKVETFSKIQVPQQSMWARYAAVMEKTKHK